MASTSPPPPPPPESPQGAPPSCSHVPAKNSAPAFKITASNHEKRASAPAPFHHLSRDAGHDVAGLQTLPHVLSDHLRSLLGTNGPKTHPGRIAPLATAPHDVQRLPPPTRPAPGIARTRSHLRKRPPTRGNLKPRREPVAGSQRTNPGTFEN